MHGASVQTLMQDTHLQNLLLSWSWISSSLFKIKPNSEFFENMKKQSPIFLCALSSLTIVRGGLTLLLFFKGSFPHMRQRHG